MKSTVQDRSDEELLELLQNGDREALEMIYFRYADYLFSFSVKRLNCNDTAADLIQELFLKLWIKKGSLVVKGELQAYLIFCLKNIIIDHYSHELVKNKYFTIASVSEVDNHTVELLNYNETRQTLHLGVNALPEKMREIFHLGKMEGYSIDEIADKLDLSRQTVKNQLGSAIKRLRVSMGSFLTLF